MHVLTLFMKKYVRVPVSIDIDPGGMQALRNTGLQELLRHVRPTTLVDDVRTGQDDLEGDDEEDEEAHSGGGGGDHYTLLVSRLHRQWNGHRGIRG